MQEIKVRLTFTEEILGTAAADKEIHKTYIASLAPNAPSKKEEVEAVGVEETIEKAMTVFPRNKEGVPIYWDYQIKGFFKDAAGMLRKVPNTKSSKIKAYKKEIDGLIFVKERQIPIHFDGEIGNCERPLRGQTPQGERVDRVHCAVLDGWTGGSRDRVVQLRRTSGTWTVEKFRKRPLLVGLAGRKRECDRRKLQS